MKPANARPAKRLLPLLLLGLLPACAEKETVFPRDTNLNVPEDYASPQLAAAAARAGDQIIVSYRAAAYVGDLDLPTGVSMIGHVENPLLPRITGQVTVNGGDDRVKIARLGIDNPAGSGLHLVGSACKIEELWIHDCDGPGIELIGDAPAYILACDIQRCGPGILIRDTTQGGNYGDVEHPAARITDCNFLENGPAGDLDNLVFANIPVLYTVYVESESLGRGRRSACRPSTPRSTTTRTMPVIRGLADTSGQDFSSWPSPIDHWWRTRIEGDRPSPCSSPSPPAAPARRRRGASSSPAWARRLPWSCAVPRALATASRSPGCRRASPPSRPP